MKGIILHKDSDKNTIRRVRECLEETAKNEGIENLFTEKEENDKIIFEVADDDIVLFDMDYDLQKYIISTSLYFQDT